MSKVKLILEVVNDMQKLAESLKSVCDALSENGFVTDEIPAVSKTKEQDIPLEKVRMVLAEKSLQGFTDEVRKIIGKYGADKLSAVDKSFYADILKDAEVLGNG